MSKEFTVQQTVTLTRYSPLNVEVDTTTRSEMVQAGTRGRKLQYTPQVVTVISPHNSILIFHISMRHQQSHQPRPDCRVGPAPTTLEHVVNDTSLVSQEMRTLGGCRRPSWEVMGVALPMSVPSRHT